MEIIDLANRQIQHSYVHLVQLEANIQKTLVENAVAADLVDDSASVVSGYSTATEQTAGPSALLRAAVDIDKSADSQEELDAAAPNKIFYIEEEEEAPEESVAAADG